MRVINLTNQTFGRLTVLDASGTDSRRNTLWRCRCSCGNATIVRGTRLRSGETKSCGCLMRERVSIHGHCAHYRHSPEYTSYAHMKERCVNPHNNRFYLYGARGIRVCNRWLHSFPNFLADMGRRPSRTYTLDRIDNDGNYEPTNCRWATKSQQRRNQRSV
jgi:hypothetical protein